MSSLPLHRMRPSGASDRGTAGRKPDRLRSRWLWVLLALLLAAWPIAAAAAPVQQDGTYVVQPGDNLTRIAARLGVSPAALAEANGIRNADFVYVGQRLLVPGGALPQPAPTPGGTHIVQRGDSLIRLAEYYGVSVAALMQANGLRSADFIWIGQQLTIPGSVPQPTPTPLPTLIPLPTPLPTPIPVPLPSPAATLVSQESSQNNCFSFALNYRQSCDTYSVTVPQPTATPLSQPTAVPQPSEHLVGAGDTLSNIAAHYNTTVAALMAANDLTNPNFVWMGQRLKVSQGGAPLPVPTLAPVNAAIPGRWIDVSLSQQRLTAFEGQTPVFTTLVSSGLPGTPTVIGTFAVNTKLVAQAMSGPGYYLPNVPYVMYFYAGYAIHGTYWHNNFGYPMSHGCVNVSTPDAAWLFGWASIGTPVVVHY